VLSLVRYLGDTFWPSGLAAFYSRESPSAVTLLAAVAATCGLTVLALLAARRHPWAATGWLWWLVGLLPVLGLVQVGAQARADRYTYLPSLGLLVVVVWGAATLAEIWRVPRAVLAAAALAALACCVGVTRTQIAHWRDSRAVFGRMLAVDPDSHVGHFNLGKVELDEGHVAAAVEHYRRAVAVKPGFAPGHSHLGAALRLHGDLAAARRSLETAIRLDPQLAGAHLNLAIVLDDQGAIGPAAGHLATALVFEPELEAARRGLAALLARPDGPRQARPYLAAVARRWPQSTLLGGLVAALEARAPPAADDRAPSVPAPPPTSPAPRAPAPR
jgi:tetratricopeptide (TPR) repeat protein